MRKIKVFILVSFALLVVELMNLSNAIMVAY